MMETSPVAEVDTMFRQMIHGYKLPIDASEANDGTYYGLSPNDAFDYRHEITIEIKDGNIVAADYNEVHRNGKGKEEDEAYCEEMKVSGTTPALAACLNFEVQICCELTFSPSYTNFTSPINS